MDRREYWTDPEGEMKPGRTGISLNPEQQNQLKEQTSDIDDTVGKIQNRLHKTCTVLVVSIHLLTLAFVFSTFFSKLLYFWSSENL